MQRRRIFIDVSKIIEHVVKYIKQIYFYLKNLYFSDKKYFIYKKIENSNILCVPLIFGFIKQTVHMAAAGIISLTEIFTFYRGHLDKLPENSVRFSEKSETPDSDNEEEEIDVTDVTAAESAKSESTICYDIELSSIERPIDARFKDLGGTICFRADGPRSPEPVVGKFRLHGRCDRSYGCHILYMRASVQLPDYWDKYVEPYTYFAEGIPIHINRIVSQAAFTFRYAKE